VRGSLVRQVSLLLGLAFLPAIGQALYFRHSTAWQKQPSADSAPVTLAQAESWGASTLWVDARPDDDFARAHVPGALPLNEDRWNELLRGVLVQWAPERRVVVYCSRLSCHTSHEVAERLRKEAGLKNVYVLEGGWEEWEKVLP
jgi:rhodanese-related sulfurtransferase